MPIGWSQLEQHCWVRKPEKQRRVLQFVKCGFAGDTLPRATFPCVVGRPLPGSGQVPDCSSTKVRPWP